MGFRRNKLVGYLGVKPEQLTSFSAQEAKEFLHQVTDDISVLEADIQDLKERNKALSAYVLTLKDELKAIQEARLNNGVLDRFWKLLAVISAFIGSCISWAFHKKDDG